MHVAEGGEYGNDAAAVLLDGRYVWVTGMESPLFQIRFKRVSCNTSRVNAAGIQAHSIRCKLEGCRPPLGKAGFALRGADTIGLRRTSMRTLGERIRELREAKDLSVRELAKRLGLSAPFLSDVELGRRHPSDEVLSKLAGELGSTVAELRKYDARPPISDLRRMAATNPAMGFALRKVVEDDVDPEELLRYLNQRGRKS